MDRPAVESIRLAYIFHKGKRGDYPEKWFHYTCPYCQVDFSVTLSSDAIKPDNLDAETWIRRLVYEDSKKHFINCRHLRPTETQT